MNSGKVASPALDRSKLTNTPRQSGTVIPHSVRWHGRIAARIVWMLISLANHLVRFRWHDESGMFQEGRAPEPLIFCTWHNRLALSLNLYRLYVQKRHPSRRLAAIVSASKDGALLARVLDLFDVEPVRGSTSRRGPQALKELTSWAKRGLDLAITPDGPRGPCYVVQEGVIALAQLTRRQILPVVFHLNWKFEIKTWDRFQIPLPFARCDVYLGKPLSVPREARDEDRESLRQQLEQQMLAMTKPVTKLP